MFKRVHLGSSGSTLNNGPRFNSWAYGYGKWLVAAWVIMASVLPLLLWLFNPYVVKANPLGAGVVIAMNAVVMSQGSNLLSYLFSKNKEGYFGEVNSAPIRMVVLTGSLLLLLPSALMIISMVRDFTMKILGLEVSELDSTPFYEVTTVAFWLFSVVVFYAITMCSNAMEIKRLNTKLALHRFSFSKPVDAEHEALNVTFHDDEVTPLKGFTYIDSKGASLLLMTLGVFFVGLQSLAAIEYELMLWVSLSVANFALLGLFRDSLIGPVNRDIYENISILQNHMYEEQVKRSEQEREVNSLS